MTIILAKWTIDEYHSMIEAGLLNNRQVELLKGKIVEMSPEGEAHAYFSSEAEDYLRILLDDCATIRSAKPITLLDNSEPEPDVAIVQRLGREYLQHHPYSENIFWLIEYSDTSLEKAKQCGLGGFPHEQLFQEDLNIKTKVHAEAGIKEYWVANLQKRQLIVFREPEDGEYAAKFTTSKGVVYPVAFPDLAVEVNRIISQ